MSTMINGGKSVRPPPEHNSKPFHFVHDTETNEA